ncbi:MAG: hypothetical protein EOP82_27580 [Variovorax sp.]|nr:MAG: hypothetical protein EOP82_27580 [Variovorax sp.]
MKHAQPPQNFRHLKDAFKDLLEAERKHGTHGEYLIARPLPDGEMADGTVPQDKVRYLATRSKLSGPALTRYRLSETRAGHYKHARRALQALVREARKELPAGNEQCGRGHRERFAAQ